MLTAHDLNDDCPYPNEHFNVVIAMMIIEHLFDPFHSFSEISRLLTNGGQAFINLPLITSIKNRARLLFGRLPLTSAKNWWDLEEWDGGHLHYFTVDSITNLGSKYGLILDAIYPVGPGYALKSMWPRFLCNEASFVFTKRVIPL
jgi:SAM-dependent methyltransferase